MRLSPEWRDDIVANMRTGEKVGARLSGIDLCILDLQDDLTDTREENATLNDALIDKTTALHTAKRQIELLGYLLEEARGESEMGDPADSYYSAADRAFLARYWPRCARYVEAAEVAADWPTGEGRDEIDSKEDKR